jgi:hypothetical protein
MEPVTAREINTSLKDIYGIKISEEETRQYLENLRSGILVKLAIAGPIDTL